MSLHTAIHKFLSDFEAFDGPCVNAALSSLTADTVLLRQGRQRLGLHARLTLIRRLALARPVDQATVSLLDRVMTGSTVLQQKYRALARIAVAYARNESLNPLAATDSESPVPVGLGLPSILEMSDYLEETANLVRLLDAFSQKCQSRSAANSSPVLGQQPVNTSSALSASI